jgi:DNA polymerase III delta prime subunit
MSDFIVKKASRQGVIPLIGFYGESGTGKTYSALLLARGLVGQTGKIIMLDTENGRGRLYADVIPGGYDVIDLTDPFSPMRYREAMAAAIKAECSALIIDSMSHEWEGVGSVLDMAHEIEERSGKPGLHCWKTPKMEHAKMMLSILQAPVPVIVLMRAHYKSRQGRNEKTGKTEIIKDDHTTPIQSEAFIYEMTVHGEIMRDHKFRMTKCSHPALVPCFPKDGMIEIKHGELLRQWCDAPTMGAKADAPKGVIAVMKKKLWALTEKEHQGDPKALEQWLWDEAILGEQETLSDLNEVRLQEVIKAVEAKQQPKEQLL